MTTRTLALFLLAPLLLGAAGPQGQQQAPAKPLLALEAVEVHPSFPGVATLCQLRVKVRNGGAKKASALAFEVKVDGQALPVYRNQVYLQTIEPGATGEVRLFNFWTTESSRPAPKAGKLELEVTLREAQWVDVRTKDGAEVWSPLGKVPGLPVSRSLTVPLRPDPAKPGS